MALVELAREGDAEAFGQLYDHYQGSVYRFLYYRTRSTSLAEDLTSETFLRALRGMNGFRWQGKDFGAWLMRIARNLCSDHFKAGRTASRSPPTTWAGTTTPPRAWRTRSSPADERGLLDGLRGLSEEQRDCLILRFLQGLTIAE